MVLLPSCTQCIADGMCVTYNILYNQHNSIDNLCVINDVLIIQSGLRHGTFSFEHFYTVLLNRHTCNTLKLM